MKFKKIYLLDMRFQAKYGFYFLYTVLSVIYLIIVLAIPESWREKAAAILIFSDPASMGLFFMGAIVLLEKNQHIPYAFAVSPVHCGEYILAKVSSLAVVSLAVAAVLALAAKIDNIHVVLFGTLMSSVVFTLLGIIAAANIESLNQFILRTVPIETVCFVPAILHLYNVTPAWCGYYPINVSMDMVSGHFPSVTAFLSVTVMMVILFVLSGFCVLKMWDGNGRKGSHGGVKL